MTTLARSSVTGGRPSGENLSDLLTARQVLRQVRTLPQPSEVDDTREVVGGGTGCEALGCRPVGVGEVGLLPHRVDQVVGGVAAPEGGGHVVTGEDVGPTDLDLAPPGTVVELARGAGQTHHLVSPVEEERDETAPYVPGGPGDGDLHHVQAIG